MYVLFLGSTFSLACESSQENETACVIIVNIFRVYTVVVTRKDVNNDVMHINSVECSWFELRILFFFFWFIPLFQATYANAYDYDYIKEFF